MLPQVSWGGDGNRQWLRIHLRGKGQSLKEDILVTTFHHFESHCGGLSPPGSSPRPSFLIITSPTQSPRHHHPGKVGRRDGGGQGESPSRRQEQRNKRSISSGAERAWNLHNLGSPFMNTNAKLQTQNCQGPFWGSGRVWYVRGGALNLRLHYFQHELASTHRANLFPQFSSLV